MDPNAPLINPNPVIHRVAKINRETSLRDLEDDNDVRDEFDSLEIFDLIRGINDPEHPKTLEELNVVQHALITVNDEENRIFINFTPTIPHCSMSTLIGLSLRVKLLRSLPRRFKVDIKITPGTHNQEDAVNKQINDKERIAAALENETLLTVVNKCVEVSI